jgi:single-strand DNA-binding protein
MPNYANVTLIGHLGRDPETKYTDGGMAVVSFSVATSRKQRDQETTTWWRCTAFGKRGESLAQYFHKGDAILVNGEPSMRPWTAQDGTERQSLEVAVNDWSFVGAKGQGRASADFQAPDQGQRTSQGGNASQGRSGASSVGGDKFDDEIPF